MNLKQRFLDGSMLCELLSVEDFELEKRGTSKRKKGKCTSKTGSPDATDRIYRQRRKACR